VAEVTFTDAAVDDLRRIGPSAVPRVLRKVLLLVDNPEAGYPLGGDLTGFRKLVVGRNTWRIVYRVTEDKSVEICEIWAVGWRADAEVYGAATARIAEATRRRPELRPLAELIERLGRLAGDVAAPETVAPPEIVPAWLADRLVHIVGMAPEEVAALSLREAVDRWAEFTATPRS
jgi:mRNA interferase RelE/StbE